MTWKEDVNDTYPGKGKALFQVKNLNLHIDNQLSSIKKILRDLDREAGIEKGSKREEKRKGKGKNEGIRNGEGGEAKLE